MPKLANPSFAGDERLDITIGTAVRFVPCRRGEVPLFPLVGNRLAPGFIQSVMGKLD
ncbi:urease subunit beta [Sedimentitalea todarodis]|uniref:Urease subunit beta n=1 Tax=Sedimentitalea todarodis TaxID=1631240 RepID=A0ABU3VEV9_9RHOB|nr:urease subunit beta [Sedimentitalea todarodis]MDU9004555.1 urease subunit beta [Sedimentitalea todarodis]